MVETHHVQPADWRRPIWGCLQLTVMALGLGSILLNAVLLTRYVLPGTQLTTEGESVMDFSGAVQQHKRALDAMPRANEDDGGSIRSTNNPQMMHGPLGLNSDGTPAHVPTPPPPPVGFVHRTGAKSGYK